MTKVIRVRKGLTINLKGTAAAIKKPTKASSVYALVPADFTGVTPKLLIKEGDMVMAGDALFVNKHCPAEKFVTPVSGKISLIERGERRKVLSVRITADETQQYKKFDVKALAEMTAQSIKELLLDAGLFSFIKQRPYDITANPDDTPKAIFVSAFNKMPLAADFCFVLKGQEADFQTGISALSKMAKVHLGISTEQADGGLAQTKDAEITVFDGPNPSGNVGVQINAISPVNKGEVVWTLNAEEVLFIGRLLRTGKIDLTRTLALAGSEVKDPCYYDLLIGAELSSILENNLSTNQNIRILNGNPLVGVQTTVEGFLSAHTTEVTVIPEGDDVHEMLGWIMPRVRDFSTNRSYFSWLLGKKSYTLDARIKGGERHIIMSGEYDKVFPMDIYAGFLIKAIITGDIDRMEALGIYEVAPEDFAVAEFVDSSKLELQRIVREGLDMLRKEMA
ncbi:MAG: Na(+)-translocating NADH-quinone reductase subunit A [Bacteroidaceae bacterium]